MTFGAGSFGGVIGGWVSKRTGLASVFPSLAVLLVPSILAIVVLWAVFRPTPTKTPTPDLL